MDRLLSTKDAQGYGIIDAADQRGYKNRYIDCLQKLALERENVFGAPGVVLDFGCGVGRLSSWLGERCHRVYGIDVSPELIHTAREYNGRDNVLYCVFDGMDLPFACQQFDGILCVGVLHKRIFPQPKFSHVVTEFARVLKPTGTVVVIEHIYGRKHPLYYAREELLAIFQQQYFHCVSAYPIRKGHWPLLYLMRFGGIPPRFFPSLAHYELERRRYQRESRFDYKDFLLRFAKKA